MFLRNAARGLVFTTILACGLSSPAVANECRVGSAKDDYSIASAWSGAYVGAHAGYSWGEIEFSDGTDSASIDVNGAAYGGHAGYNWQCGSFVWGIEADLDGSAASESLVDGTTTVTAENAYLASIRGRVGVASDGMLVYATAGVSFGKVELQVVDTDPFAPVNARASTTVVGFVVGSGAEMKLSNSLSGRLELLRYGGLDGRLRFDGGSLNEDYDTTVFRGGISYHFH